MNGIKYAHNKMTKLISAIFDICKKKKKNKKAIQNQYQISTDKIEAFTIQSYHLYLTYFKVCIHLSFGIISLNI